MRAVQVTCPNCGAKLDAGAGDVVTCSYCGTASRVQRRTRVFERTLPVPAQRDLPVTIAVQTRSRTAVLLALLVTVLMPVVAISAVVCRVRETVDSARGLIQTASRTIGPSGTLERARGADAELPPEQRRPTWQGTNTVLLADVNHDGTDDVVGRGRQVPAGDLVRLIALDGKTGALLWKSEPLGTYTTTYRGTLALSGGLALFAAETGEVRAYSVDRGELRWKVTLPERTSYFCQGDDATVIAVTADDTLRPLARADGAAGPAEPRTSHPRGSSPRGRRRDALCPPLTDDAHPASSRQNRSLGWELEQKLDLSVRAVIEIDGVRVLAAERRTGTRVTTLVALDAKGDERWRVAAAPDALTATGAPRAMAAGAGTVCATYATTSHRLACFKLADGARVWDEAASPFTEGLQIAGDTLLVASSDGVEVRDLASGRLRWSAR